MKKLFYILAIAAVFASCVMPAAGIKETNVIDYKRYFKKGFFLTESNSVNFDYSPIASVSTTVKGSVKVESAPKSNKRQEDQGLFGARINSNNTKTNAKYTIHDAIDELVIKSHSLGANGIINFTITYTYDKEYGRGYIVSGMAIRR